MTDILSQFIEWYMGHINYLTIFFLMAIESSFIPFPSEIVIPPASYLAAQGELQISWVVVSGTAGSLAGALFNYYLALFLGRKLIYAAAGSRYAGWFLINLRSVERSERYFLKYGNISTLIGRLVPAIRQLISIPAGLAKMPLKPFILFTIIGSGIWNTILAALGYFFFANKELLDRNYHLLSVAGAAIAVIFVVYLMMRKGIKSKKQNPYGNET